MRVALRFAVVVAFAGVLAGLVVAGGADGDKKTAAPEPSRDDEVLRDGFETPQPVWEREHTDTVIRLLEHDRSQRAAHGGRLSEHFHFEAGPGSQFFVSYATPENPGLRRLEDRPLRPVGSRGSSDLTPRSFCRPTSTPKRWRPRTCWSAARPSTRSTAGKSSSWCR